MTIVGVNPYGHSGGSQVILLTINCGLIKERRDEPNSASSVIVIKSNTSKGLFVFHSRLNYYAQEMGGLNGPNLPIISRLCMMACHTKKSLLLRNIDVRYEHFFAFLAFFCR